MALVSSWVPFGPHLCDWYAGDGAEEAFYTSAAYGRRTSAGKGSRDVGRGLSCRRSVERAESPGMAPPISFWFMAATLSVTKPLVLT